MARALGITDAVTSCDCCGKSGLRRTVCMELDGGELVHYGTTCASRNTGKPRAVIAAEVRQAEAARLTAARQEWRQHPAFLAERARYAERDQHARETGQRMSGRAAMEFVQAVGNAADNECRALTARHGVPYWAVRNG